jgi:hypothetical protein
MSLKLQQRKVFGIDLENYNLGEEEVLVFGSYDGVYCSDGKSVKKLLKGMNGLGL